MKTIKIMRGVPGAGKSTLANKYGGVICSADHYFMVNGEYKFDATKLGEAHKKCMQDFLSAVIGMMPTIVVDNTNINVEDIAPYVAVGEAMGYDVEVVQVNVPPHLGAGRNVHRVPEDAVLRMYDRLSKVKLPKRWKVRQVN